jgi:hypothetical protein
MSQKITITAYSTALFSTWIFVDQWRLLLDAGDGVCAGFPSEFKTLTTSLGRSEMTVRVVTLPSSPSISSDEATYVSLAAVPRMTCGGSSAGQISPSMCPLAKSIARWPMPGLMGGRGRKSALSAGRSM